MGKSSESSTGNFHANTVQPPSIDELRSQLTQVRSSVDCLHLCSTLTPKNWAVITSIVSQPGTNMASYSTPSSSKPGHSTLPPQLNLYTTSTLQATPPITIDNIKQFAQLLKRLETLTKQNLLDRVVGRGLRVYPETPAAYHQIRNLIEKEQLEAFTHELNENKEIKVVVRGMPIQEIMDDPVSLFIKPSECRLMTNRKTGLPMPLFLLSLPKTDDNKNIYHITELCNMKITTGLNKKTGPTQCFWCQGFFHSSKFCTRNPECVKCGKPHMTRDCKKTTTEEPTCCHCQEKHLVNFLGCPKNPLNKPPPPPKVNAWEERIKKRKEMQEAAKLKAEHTADQQVRPSTSTPTKPNPTVALPNTSASKPPPQPQTQQDSGTVQPSSFASTLENFQDPQVIEMLGVLKKFNLISKSRKSRPAQN
ncbi:RNA-directed DNA polymerase from mobile element jockey [Trichonephila clavipes]|nr:RNA-directed DNA polymerase from mobile element jockey [Trichonephila clavipes]